MVKNLQEKGHMACKEEGMCRITVSYTNHIHTKIQYVMVQFYESLHY